VSTWDWDAIVIGSGLGGLTAAAYLTTNGLRTLVLEHHYVAGGNAQVFRRKALRGKKSFEFDVGVHYVGDCEPEGLIPAILRGVGLEGKIEFLEMNPDGFDTLIFPGLTFRVPKGWDRYRERLIAAFPDEETGLHHCLDVLQRQAPDFMQWAMRPLSELFDDCGLSQKARAVLGAESGAYGSPPSRAPVIVQAGLLDHYLKGAYYPKGGGQMLPGHLVDVIRSHDGEVRVRARVERILVEDGHALGVRLATGEEFRAPIVISNADVKRTFLELVGEEHLAPEKAAILRDYRMALPIFCVYLALDIDLSEQVPNTNFWYYTTFDIEGIYQDCYQGRIPSELGLFITMASVKDPHTQRIAPDGFTSLEIMSWVPPDYRLWGGIEDGPTAGEKYHNKPEYRAYKDELTDLMVAGAQEVLPGIKDHIIWKEAATPITQEHYTRSTGGTSYGLEIATDQFGPHRPPPKTEIDGLFLAGASTIFGHGIVGVMRGGVGCASAVLNRDLLAEVEGGRVFGDPSRLTAGGPGWDPWEACRWSQREAPEDRLS
jgi:phytoene dehydrogenase-like protein